MKKLFFKVFENKKSKNFFIERPEKITSMFGLESEHDFNECVLIFSGIYFKFFFVNSDYQRINTLEKRIEVLENRIKFIVDK